MTKPHEEKWLGAWRDDGYRIVSASGRDVLRAAKDTTKADLSLAEAAPEMARALGEAAHYLALLADGDPAWRAKGALERVQARVQAARESAGVL